MLIMTLQLWRELERMAGRPLRAASEAKWKVWLEAAAAVLGCSHIGKFFKICASHILLTEKIF